MVPPCAGPHEILVIGKDVTQLRLFSAIVLLLCMLTSVVAQETASTQVDTASHPELGKYLVDREGMSLYMFENDTEQTSACYDDCAEAWPPLIAEGDVTAGEGVAGTLISTFERSDGTIQVAYNGMPLYRFVQDEEPGSVAGHGVNDVWFLVSPFGTAVAVPEPEEEASEEAAGSRGEEMDAMAMASLMGQGKSVYDTHCAACHGRSGEGVRAPALADNARLGNTERMIGQILRGGSHMPGFGAVLDNEQVAAVMTYISNSWGNDLPPVTEEEVRRQR
jgi:predicted lipoprotein with Yx(FWY)xxD motif